MGLYDYTMYDVICRNARIYPDREAIVFKHIRLSHREYKERCDRLAAGLTRLGTKIGDRIAILAQNSDEFMILYGACAKIGAIVLPVNWRMHQDEVEYVLKDCTPRIIFAGLDYQKMVAELAKKLKFMKRCYTIGGGNAQEDFYPFESLYSEDGSEDEFDIPVNAGFVIIHTAAVEGRPRGALLTQANIVFANLVYMHRYALSPEDCHICILPLYHSAALGMVTSVMQAGGKNVVLDRFDPDITLQLIENEKGTMFFNFSPILKRLMDRYDQNPYNLSTIRNVMGLDHPENIQRFSNIAPDATYWTGYGQTETMLFSACPFHVRPGCAGKPCPLARVAILDEYDNELPVGSTGEICVRSPMVFSGYWGRERENTDIFRNGWHHTGDLGRFDEEGFLWYAGRKAEKELIKPGGENVYPAEVEKVVLEHPAVEKTVVFGVPDPEWKEGIKAVCQLKEGKALEPQALIQFVGERIARFKKPQYVEFVADLPVLEDGSPDRAKVKELYGGEQ